MICLKERRQAEKTAWEQSNTELAKNLFEVEEKVWQTVATQRQDEKERRQARASLLVLERLNSEAEQSGRPY
ncbi:hypothetical protein DPEC_G00023110 [Dallia pectoralis]|uniref:Uncharacterized protein n=1 Tax=Dallia pectoralis TaxID=75939 RepID=A0ACC2HHN6_DALPE|nr:hypothetical protein DPEC_G00023110 [Dallia pectoralis]